MSLNDALAAGRAGLDPAVFDPLGAVRADAEALDGKLLLPGDHPAWQRDVLSLSARARAVIATLRPLALRVLSFWDHRIREVTLGSRTLSIDPCGSYRLR